MKRSAERSRPSSSFSSMTARAQLEREVRPARKRRAVFVHGPQPCGRTHQEADRRHHVKPRAEIAATEPRADQSHVVIERQPAHEHVGRCRLHGVAHRAHVFEQAVMREHHALRVAGRARGVLHQPERFRVVQRRQRQRGAFRRERRDGLDAFQRLDLAAQQHRELAALRHRDQHARARIAQDHDLAAHVLFELRHARRRIDRHRHGAGIENAEERGEEIRAVGSIIAMRSPGTMSRLISPCATARAAVCRSR